jgi:hypothetical protein
MDCLEPGRNANCRERSDVEGRREGRSRSWRGPTGIRQGAQSRCAIRGKLPMKFPYRQYHTTPSPTAPGGILHRPEIPLRLFGSTGAISLWALVDAGSDDTLYPLSVAQMIGASLDPTQSWKVEGIGGHAVPIILGEIVLEVSDGNQTFQWPSKVGFADFADPQDEVSLVGHAGCLDYFRVIYDGHLRTLEINVTPAFPGQRK